MAGSIVQSKWVTGAASAGTAAGAFAVNNASGNAIVVFVFDGTVSGRTFSISDTNTNSYGSAKLLDDTNNNTTSAAFVTTAGIASGANTVTVTCTNGSTDRVNICIIEVAGVASNPLDGFAAQSQVNPGAANNSISSSPASNANTAFAIGCCNYTNPGSNTIAAGTNFTSSASGNIVVKGWSGSGLGTTPGTIEWQASIPSGSTAATFTDNTDGASNDYNSLIVMLNEIATDTLIGQAVL